jgi:hypothetical protein
MTLTGNGGNLAFHFYSIQQGVEKRYRGSRDKTKTGEKAQFSELNEHFEPVFNTVFGNVDSFSTSC